MKNKTLKIAALLLCFIMLFSGCGYNSGTALMKVESSTGTSWKQSHALLSGKEVRNLSLGDEPKEMEIEIVTEKGKIDLTITGSDGEKILFLDDAETGNYEFKASGKIKIEVKAENHKGSFNIKEANS